MDGWMGEDVNGMPAGLALELGNGIGGKQGRVDSTVELFSSLQGVPACEHVIDAFGEEFSWIWWDSLDRRCGCLAASFDTPIRLARSGRGARSQPPGRRGHLPSRMYLVGEMMRGQMNEWNETHRFFYTS